MKVQKKINSFTIGFKEKSYDESLYVKNSKFNKNTKKILNNKKLFESVNLLKKNFFSYRTHPLFRRLNYIKWQKIKPM